jgi:hypothetical protein
MVLIGVIGVDPTEEKVTTVWHSTRSKMRRQSRRCHIVVQVEHDIVSGGVDYNPGTIVACKGGGTDSDALPDGVVISLTCDAEACFIREGLTFRHCIGDYGEG